MDFNIKIYQELLKSLQSAGFSFITFSEYLTHIQNNAASQLQKVIILRHDVDLLPLHSLRFAQIQHTMGIKGSYYFRAVPESWDEKVINEIASLGHEVGYHYENMDTALLLLTKTKACPERSRREQQTTNNEQQTTNNEPRTKNNEQKTTNHEQKTTNNEQRTTNKEQRTTNKEQKTTNNKQQTTNNEQKTTNKNYPENLIDLAYQDFLNNLDLLRKLVDVKTICMHGSPRAKYDNKAIWEKYNYKSLGLLGEPYYDMNFNDFFYLTDTGRRWDGWKVSIRDKVPQQDQWSKQGLVFKSTQDIIQAANQSQLPQKIMFTFHPQRWSDNWFLWSKEFVLQNAKNQVKRFLVKTR